MADGNSVGVGLLAFRQGQYDPFISLRMCLYKRSLSTPFQRIILSKIVIQEVRITFVPFR